MMSKTAVVLVTALVTGSAIAQPQAAAVVTRVEGLATMNYEQTVRTVQPGTPVPQGATIFTGAGGSISIEAVISGSPCEVDLGPGQAFTMAAGKSCKQLVSSVQNLATATAAAAEGTGGGGTAGTATGGTVTGTGAGGGTGFLGTGVSVATAGTVAAAAGLVGAVAAVRGKKTSGD
jgi:hypothetical protein